MRDEKYINKYTATLSLGNVLVIKIRCACINWYCIVLYYVALYCIGTGINVLLLSIKWNCLFVDLILYCCYCLLLLLRY